MNFQNIPRSDKVVKRAFIPKLDALVYLDYKQIEPRLLAYFMSMAIGDDLLASKLRAGEDTYTTIVKQIYGKEAHELTDEERQTGKVLFLSLMYGGGERTVIMQFGVDWPEAKRMTSQFHNAWPGVRKLQRSIDRVIEHRGFIRTPWGRHLHPESPHKSLNALIQGSAADLMRHALINTHDMLTFADTKSHLVSVIHDEVVLDATLDEIPFISKVVPACMDYPTVSMVVPILVDMEWTESSWADKQAYEGV